VSQDHAFDKDYWDQHWERGGGPGTPEARTANPYLIRETSGLAPGTALDAGCGEGAEAIWLACRGWHVTAADIAAEALARAAARAAETPAAGRVRWVEADLTTWVPGTKFDLVTTNYAHPAMPQLAFYERIAEWVAPGGTLLIVGHLHGHDPAGHDAAGHEHHPPAKASVTAADITAVLDTTTWEIVTAEEHSRTLDGHDGRALSLRDAVVRAIRRDQRPTR
jgi:SAM-dependent methyltransferase